MTRARGVMVVVTGLLFGLGLRVSSGADAPRPTPEPGALKQQALALLGHWVESQNKPDVNGYLAVYDHKHFRGRKRTQKGATDLDWKGWAADRTSMLKRNPTVAAERPTVETWLDRGSKLKRGIVRLRFLQRWKSARYADHGMKILDLFLQPDGSLLALHEELLNSEPGWDDTSKGEQLQLGKVGTVEEADKALAAIGLTAGNVEERLQTLPDAPQLRRLVALAILERGSLACDKIVNESQCGDEIIEWEALDAKLPWSHPCTRRRAALWALEQDLSPAELERVAPKLEPILEIGKPELEIPKAVMDRASKAPDALRLRLLRALNQAHKALAESSLEGLSPASLATAASALHLDAAALKLDPKKQRDALLSAVRDDALTVATRVALIDHLTGLRGKEVDDLLRELSDQAPSCELSAKAGVTLADRGDKSRLPRRPKDGGTDELLAREVCRLLHDPDRTRAEARWLEFLPRRGKVKVTQSEDNEFADRDEDGNRIQPEFPVETVTRKTSSLSDLDETIGEGNAPTCGAEGCDFLTGVGHLFLIFKDSYLVEIHRSRWIGCPC